MNIKEELIRTFNAYNIKNIIAAHLRVVNIELQEISFFYEGTDIENLLKYTENENYRPTEILEGIILIEDNKWLEKVNVPNTERYIWLLRETPTKENMLKR